MHPSQSGSVITKLPRRTTSIVEGRDCNAELAAGAYARRQRARLDGDPVSCGSIEAISIRNLPDMTGVDLICTPPPTAEQPAAPVIPAERTDYPALWLDDAVLRNARAIYARGQQRGNNPNSLIKIGESNTAGTVYMCTFHYGNYDLGPYARPAAVVDRFNSTGSFCHYDYTARSGFATANLLDPQWAIEPECRSGETPLQCGYRIYKPSYALIYLGIADMGFYTEKQFHDNLIDDPALPEQSTASSRS